MRGGGWGGGGGGGWGGVGGWGGGGGREEGEEKEFEMALMDRVMRSASGQEAGAFLLEG